MAMRTKSTRVALMVVGRRGSDRVQLADEPHQIASPRQSPTYRLTHCRYCKIKTNTLRNYGRDTRRGRQTRGYGDFQSHRPPAWAPSDEMLLRA
jgi:hypothetical protein